MKKNIFEIVADVLMTKQKYLSGDGRLLKATVYSDVMTMESDLLTLLLSNEQIKDRFFKNVNGVLVFDKQKFAWFIESKEFLPDSYTRYTNKIGLTNNNGDFISKSNDVILDFPYKDCVLEGGQDKEDQRRKEIFYNEIIASDEITRMLAPKVFTNAKRYTRDGVEENITFNSDDNLIIKGNNLIALSSILKRYEGKVKCIYIDPPYNTGNDSFNYNDSFNHSAWLTFMKNRLELAQKLLREDGIIFVQCDYNEHAYLKVLMDDVFGRENFINNITCKVKAPSGLASGANMFFDTAEYILVYSKNKKATTYNHVYQNLEVVNETSKTKNNYNYLLKKIDKSNLEFLTNIDGVDVFRVPNENYKIEKMTSFTQKDFYDNFDNVFRTAKLSGGVYEKIKNFIYTIEDRNESLFLYRYTPSKGKYENITLDSLVYKSQSVIMLPEHAVKDESDKCVYKREHVTTIMNNDWWQGIANEGGLTFKNGKKPEILIKTLLDIATNENDLVLDFFLGSGTTSAVAHKMNRRYIGIEQMNYVQTNVINRMQHVINNDRYGISNSIKWKGGGSFVYCELLENASTLIKNIQSATEDNILEMKKSIFLMNELFHM
ncbi:DNA methyltransferase [Mycoplasma sp. 3392]